MIIVLMFVSTLVGWVLVAWACLRAVRTKVENWNCYMSVWFLMSLGGFGQRAIDNWKRWGGCDEAQATIIVKHQLICWFGMILCGLAGMAAGMAYCSNLPRLGRMHVGSISVR